MINWKVRLKNKTFWITLIPMVLLLITAVLALFGIPFDATILSSQLIHIVELIFGILALIGIVNDPTTSGLTDSKQALTYEEPKND